LVHSSDDLAVIAVMTSEEGGAPSEHAGSKEEVREEDEVRK
jgi:hypothetical protein